MAAGSAAERAEAGGPQASKKRSTEVGDLTLSPALLPQFDPLT